MIPVQLRGDLGFLLGLSCRQASDRKAVLQQESRMRRLSCRRSSRAARRLRIRDDAEVWRADILQGPEAGQGRQIVVLMEARA